ncbi:hypothetical protein DFH08DRAFT_863617 [Mycena albidolilacea]|uniref:DUF6534 domain-containing protein n=1 Tax=Mycena albidolilacea TaxID=1033008 RepID=A0AAD7ERS8_9AGAR|nr:hypothetical protein DFH08DRAFT_863617 [Mycena albidolilacea]
MSAPPTALPNVELSFGPMLIGVFFNMILYGVLISQVLSYFKYYPRDAPWMKFFILSLFAVETLNTGFDMAIMYQPLILDYGAKPNFFPLFFVTEPLCIVAVSTPIQLFFAWRIKSLTKSWWIPILIVLLAIASLVGGVWTAVMISIVKTFANKPKLHNPALLWFLTACVADGLITASFVFTLSKRKTSGFSGHDSAIDKLTRVIRLTVQTGLITAICAILDVICFMALPHFAVDFVWDLALSKLYTNCLMSTLNARQRIHIPSPNSTLSEQRRATSHGLVVSPSTPRTTKHVDTPRHTDSSGIYELDTQKANYTTYDVESGYPPTHEEYDVQVPKHHMDSSRIYELEAPKPTESGYAPGGIQVTKIVERVKDPLPPHPYNQFAQ